MKKVKKVKKVTRPPNMLFPGLPNYKGPDKGWFAWVHHGKLFEHTSVDGDSIKARVHYVKMRKPTDEQRIRLAHIMYLGKSLGTKLQKMCGDGSRDYGRARLWRHDKAAELVYAYIAKHKPKNKWDRRRETLVKADGTSMTG